MKINSITPEVSVRPVQSSPGHEGVTRGRVGCSLNKSVEGFQTGISSTAGRTRVGEPGLVQAVERANKMLAESHRRFHFSVHEVTQTIMVKVIDTENNEIIREIPPEKILDLVAKLWELAGIIVDEKV